MKKKLIGLLLVLCFVVTAFPFFGMTAAAEGEGLTYADLYVQDGLVMDLAYDSGVDLSAGTWTSRVGDKTATLMNSALWKTDDKGGLYFDIDTRKDAGQDAVGLDMGIDNLPARSFTVEMVARGTGLTVGSDGVTPVTTEGMYGYQCGRAFAFGPFKGEGFPEQRPDGYVGDYNLYVNNEVRWFYSEGVLSWQETFNAYGTYGLAQENNWKNDGVMKSVQICHNRTDAASQYSVLCNGAMTSGVTAPISGWKTGEKRIIEKADDQEFILFRSFPAHIYFVRVYDRVLTNAEIGQNHFADIMAYYQVDLSKLEGLTPAKLNSLYTMFKTMDFESDKAAVEELLSSTGGASSFDPETTLYVTDGLTALFLTWDDYKSSLKLTKSGGMWIDQISGGIGTLKGNKWVQKEHGGIACNMTPAEWNAGHDFGLTLGTPFLPAEDFSVEMVINPIGLINEDGSRYVDDKTTYGTYLDYGFAFGPLKAMSFVCIRPAGKDGQLEHRWIYLASGGWNASGFKSLCTESVFSKSDPTKPITFTVTHDLKGEEGNYESLYKLYYQFEGCGQIEKWGDGYIPKDGADGMFNVMYGIPGEIYAVRVYNRLLTASEMLKNHVADLVYYYDLDTTLLEQALASVENPRSVYETFADMSFDLPREDAQRAFNATLSAMWISTLGTAARIDNKAGLRAEFRLNLEMIAGMERAGYTFEVGAIANIDKEAFPTVEENDVRIVVYKDGEKNENFFLSDDVFALAVDLKFPDAALMLKTINFGYYLILHKEGAEDMVVLSKVESTDYKNNGFSVYTCLSNGAYGKNQYVSKLLSKCYDSHELCVGEGETFETLAEAAAEAIRLFGEAETPVSVTLKLADGVHHVASPILFDSNDWDNEYYRLTIVGGDAESVKITGASAIDNAGFEKVEGKEYYKYQFEQIDDAYPEFRYLYVNGKIATLAHSGSLRYADGDDGGIAQHTMPFEMGFSADMGIEILKNGKGGYLSTADQLAAINASPLKANNKFYVHKELIPDAADVAQMELHVQTQWDFNIMHIVRVDFADTIKDDAGRDCVAVYFEETERASFQIPGGYPLKGRQYWLENAKSFVDEPGESYYDVATGTLYYYPVDDEIDTAVFEFPETDQLLIFNKMSNVTISGITFTGTDDYFLQKYAHSGGQAGGDQRTRTYYDASGSFPERSALFFRNGTYYFTLENCIFDNLACEALTMRGRIEHSKVEANQFFDIGATAIRMADGDALWNSEHGLLDIYVGDNYINNTGWSIRQCCATQFGSAKDFTMEYNSILYSSYTAISIGWRWASVNWTFGSNINLMNVNINCNYISHFMTDEKDGGAIYTLGGNVDPSYTEYFNYLYQNYIVFTKDTGCRGMVCGLYHDGSSSNWYDSDNVIVAASPLNTRQPESYYHYIYIQHIDGQETHNNFEDHNYVINLKAEDYDDQLAEAFRTYLKTKDAEGRGIKQERSEFMCGLDDLWDSDIPSIVDQVGSQFCIPDIAEIENNDF